MFHGVAFPHRALWDTAQPCSLLGPGTRGNSTGHSVSRGTTLHVPCPASAGCPLLPGWSSVTINHKSLSDATSESAQGRCPWGPFPLVPSGALPGSGCPCPGRVLGQGPAVPLVCCVSPEPEQNVTMNTNHVGAAALVCSPRCTWRLGEQAGFYCKFSFVLFSPHTPCLARSALTAQAEGTTSQVPQSHRCPARLEL